MDRKKELARQQIAIGACPQTGKFLARTVSGASEEGSVLPTGLLEVELRAELKDSRVEGRSDLAEVAGAATIADLVELRVIPGVERLHAEFQPAASGLAQDEALEQRQVPVVASRAAQ